MAIQTEIQAALSKGDVQLAGIGNYFCCPWSPIYTVKRPVTIGTTMLQPRHQFTFAVSAEELAEELAEASNGKYLSPTSNRRRPSTTAFPEATGD